MDSFDMEYQSVFSMTDLERYFGDGEHQQNLSHGDHSMSDRLSGPLLQPPFLPDNGRPPTDSMGSNCAEDILEPETVDLTEKFVPEGRANEVGSLTYKHISENSHPCMDLNAPSSDLLNEGEGSLNNGDLSHAVPTRDVRDLHETENVSNRILSFNQNHVSAAQGDPEGQIDVLLPSNLQDMPPNVIGTFLSDKNSLPSSCTGNCAVSGLHSLGPDVTHPARSNALDHQLIFPSPSDVLGVPVFGLINDDQSETFQVCRDVSGSLQCSSPNATNHHNRMDLDVTPPVIAAPLSGSDGSSLEEANNGFDVEDPTERFPVEGQSSSPNPSLKPPVIAESNSELFSGSTVPCDITFLNDGAHHSRNSGFLGSDVRLGKSMIEICTALRKFSTRISKQRKKKIDPKETVRYYSFKRITKDLNELRSFSRVLSGTAARIAADNSMLNEACAREKEEIEELRKRLESRKG